MGFLIAWVDWHLESCYLSYCTRIKEGGDRILLPFTLHVSVPRISLELCRFISIDFGKAKTERFTIWLALWKLSKNYYFSLLSTFSLNSLS
jgi:hypothetical protein